MSDSLSKRALLHLVDKWDDAGTEPTVAAPDYQCDNCGAEFSDMMACCSQCRCVFYCSQVSLAL